MSFTFAKKIWFRSLALLLIFQIPLNDFSAYAELRSREDSSTIPLVSGFGSSDSAAEFRRQEFSRRMNKLFIQKHLSGYKAASINDQAVSIETGFGAAGEGQPLPMFNGQVVYLSHNVYGVPRVFFDANQIILGLFDHNRFTVEQFKDWVGKEMTETDVMPFLSSGASFMVTRNLADAREREIIAALLPVVVSRLIDLLPFHYYHERDRAFKSMADLLPDDLIREAEKMMHAWLVIWLPFYTPALSELANRKPAQEVISQLYNYVSHEHLQSSLIMEHALSDLIYRAYEEIKSNRRAGKSMQRFLIRLRKIESYRLIHQRNPMLFAGEFWTQLYFPSYYLEAQPEDSLGLVADARAWLEKKIAPQSASVRQTLKELDRLSRIAKAKALNNLEAMVDSDLAESFGFTATDFDTFRNGVALRTDVTGPSGFGAEARLGIKREVMKWQAREKGILFGLLSSSLGAAAVVMAENVLRSETNMLALLFSASLIVDWVMHLSDFLSAQNKNPNSRLQLKGGLLFTVLLGSAAAAFFYQKLGWFLLGTYLLIKIKGIIRSFVLKKPPRLTQKARWGITMHPLLAQPFGLLAIPYFGPVFVLLSTALSPIMASVMEWFLSVKKFGKPQWVGGAITIGALLLARYHEFGSLAAFPIIFILLFTFTQALGRIILKYVQTDIPKMSPNEQVRIAYATAMWPFFAVFVIQRFFQGGFARLEIVNLFNDILTPLNTVTVGVAPLVITWALIRLLSRMTEFRTVKYTDSSTTSFLRSTSALFGLLFVAVLLNDPHVITKQWIQLISAGLTAFGIWLFVRSPVLAVSKKLAQQSKNEKLSREKVYAMFSDLAEAVTQYLYLRHRRLKPEEEERRLENIRIRLSSVMTLADLDNGVNHKIVYERLREFVRSFPINFAKHGALAWALGGNSATERWLGLPGVYSEFEESEVALNSEAPSLYSKLKLAQTSVSRRKLAPFLKRVRHDRDLAGILRVGMNSEMFAYRLNKQERVYLHRLLNEDFWVRSPEQFALKTGFNQAAFLAYLLYYLEDKSLLWNQGNALSGLLNEESQGRLGFDNILEREQFGAELGTLAATVHGIIPYRGLKHRDWKGKLERYSPMDVENYILRRRPSIKSDRTFQIDKFRIELLHIEESAINYGGEKINTWMYQVPIRSNDQELVALFAPYTPQAVDLFEKYRGKAVGWTVEQVGGKPWIFVVVPWPDYRESTYMPRVKEHYESGRLAGGIHQVGDDVNKEYTFSTIAPDIRIKVRELIHREIGSKKRILSIGPGRFLLERELVEDGHEVSTVELSEVLSKDSDETGDIQKFTGDAQHLERVLPMSIPADEQKKFDAIVLSESIAYFDGEDLAQKLGAFLKHNGRIFITTYPGDHGRPFWGYRFTPLSELTHWLSEAGFDIKTHAFYRLAEDLTQMPVPVTKVNDEASADIYLVSAGMSDFARKLNLPESPVSFSIRQATIRQLLSRRPEFKQEFDRDLGSLLEIARILAGRFEQRDLEEGFQRELMPPVIQLKPGGGEKHHDLFKGWSIRMVGKEGRYDMSIIFTDTVNHKKISSVIAVAKSQPLLPSVSGDSAAGTFSADSLYSNEDLSIDLLGISSHNAGIVVEQLEAKILATLDKFFVFGDRVIPGTLAGVSFENLLVNIVVEYVRPGIYHFRVIARDSLDPDISDAHRKPILEGHFQNANKVSGFGVAASISETMHGGTTLLITRNHAEAVYSLMNLTGELQNTILSNVSNIVMVWEGQPEEAKKWTQALARKFRLTNRRNLYHSGSFDLLKEEAVLSLLKKDLFHFGDINDLPLSIQPLRSADSYFVPNWFVWVARQRMVKTAA